MSTAGARVAMLANNDWRIDSRVVREAEALSEQGYQVSVVFRREGAPAGLVEESNGVRYVCVPRQRGSWWRIFPLTAIHLRLPGAISVLQLALLPLLAVLVAPVAIVLLPWRRRISWVRKVVDYLAQPLLYLNEYALDCQGVVAAIKPRVVHAHDLITVSCAYLVARATGARFIYDAHELESHTNYWTLNRWTRYWVRKYEAALVRKASATITVCDSIADWLAREYRIQRPVVVLNVPTVLGEEHGARAGGSRAAIRSNLGLSQTVPLAVYVGSVTIDRGLEICVRTLALLPALHFAFVGPRYAATEAAVTRLARELGVEARLHLVDPVPSADVVRFIAEADCSVIAVQNVCLSYYFAMPNKLFESALAGLPIAAGRLIEIQRFVEEFGVGVIMDETDPQDIASAIHKILSDRDRYRPTPEKLQRIAQRYGWPVQRRRLLELYGDLTNG